MLPLSARHDLIDYYLPQVSLVILALTVSLPHLLLPVISSFSQGGFLLRYTPFRWAKSHTSFISVWTMCSQDMLRSLLQVIHYNAVAQQSKALALLFLHDMLHLFRNRSRSFPYPMVFPWSPRPKKLLTTNRWCTTQLSWLTRWYVRICLTVAVRQINRLFGVFDILIWRDFPSIVARKLVAQIFSSPGVTVSV